MEKKFITLASLAKVFKAVKAAIPTKVGDLENDVSYVTENDLNEALERAPMPDMAEYAKLTDIPSTDGLVSSESLTDSLMAYAKLEDIPDTTMYVKMEELPDWTEFAKVADLSEIYLTETDLQNYVSADELADTFPTLMTQYNVATTDDIPTDYLTASALDEYAKLSDVVTTVATAEANGLMSAGDKVKLDGIDLTQYALASNIPEYTNQLVNNSGFITIDDIPADTFTGYVIAGRLSGSDLGFHATAEGTETTASGVNSHAEGNKTTSSGTASHSEGLSSRASGNYSHAQNKGTIATQDSQTSIGKYNAEDTNSAFIIGNGTANSRSNAMTVDWGGNVSCGNLNGVSITGVDSRLCDVEDAFVFATTSDINGIFNN